jgi:hypothetical protein
MNVNTINTDAWRETWIGNLVESHNCASIDGLSIGMIKDEIEDIRQTIKNESLCELGAPTLEVSDMHRDNIISMQDYIMYLQELKNAKEQHMNPYNPECKDIRFISSNYDDMFKIPDGGYIQISLSNGEQSIYKCTFIDECHTRIGNNTFHICEFAEKMEKIGSIYEPCPTPEKVGGYMITDRAPVNNKEFVLAHNPKAGSPYVTWVKHKDYPGYEIGHYWSDRRNARTDFALRVDAERTGKAYDHTTLFKQENNRDAR